MESEAGGRPHSEAAAPSKHTRDSARAPAEEVQVAGRLHFVLNISTTHLDYVKRTPQLANRLLSPPLRLRLSNPPPPAPVRLTAAALRFALAVEAGRLAPRVARDGRHLLLDLKRHLEEGRVDKGARLRTQRRAGSGLCRKP
jgi:hypothetical protein